MSGGKLCPECVSSARGMDVSFTRRDYPRAADGRFLCPFHRRFTGDV